MTSVIYPITNLKQVEELNIVRGEGIYVFDKKGKKYLEGLAGLWCASLGYGNEELIEAIAGQLRTLSYSHMFGGRTHQVVMDLAEKLTNMVPIENGKVFFANSGSEANDSHMKMLRYYFNVTGQGGQGGVEVLVGRGGRTAGRSAVPKTLIRTIIDDSMEEAVVQAILNAARSPGEGEIGDGKIFVSELKAAIRVRTGETGTDAI